MGGKIPLVTIEYRRHGGIPPADDEALLIEPDGSFRMWRTVASFRIGRFAGRLSAAELKGLTAEAAAVRDAEDFSARPPLDASVETVLVEGRRASMGNDEQPTGAWGPLLKRLRKLLDKLTQDAVAAVELTIDPSGRAAQLRHAGGESLDLGLGGLEVEVHLLDARGNPLDSWESKPRSAGNTAVKVKTTAGWQHELPMKHGFELRAGQQCQVWAVFDLFDDGARKRGRLVNATKIK
jgi:hypothetical protein